MTDNEALHLFSTPDGHWRYTQYLATCADDEDWHLIGGLGLEHDGSDQIAVYVERIGLIDD